MSWQGSFLRVVVLAAVAAIPVCFSPAAAAADKPCESEIEAPKGTFSCTVPDGMTQMAVFVGGGNGGGGGGGGWDSNVGGGGGGGGGAAGVRCTVAVTAGQVVTMTVGKGGRGGKGGTGADTGTPTRGGTGDDGERSSVAVAGEEVAAAEGGFGGDGGTAGTAEAAGTNGVPGIGGPEEASFCTGDSSEVTAGEPGKSSPHAGAVSEGGKSAGCTSYGGIGRNGGRKPERATSASPSSSGDGIKGGSGGKGCVFVTFKP
ncbi:glycine-rich domain-containing protein [Nocardia iowensis]